MFVSVSTLAGEIHYGSGDTRESACENAERRARRAALSKDTCYEQCDIRQCKKDPDGGYMCEASSANHGGSCGKSDKIDPKRDRR